MPVKREWGRPLLGKTRRTKTEIAEDEAFLRGELDRIAREAGYEPTGETNSFGAIWKKPEKEPSA